MITTWKVGLWTQIRRIKRGGRRGPIIKLIVSWPEGPPFSPIDEYSEVGQEKEKEEQRNQ